MGIYIKGMKKPENCIACGADFCSLWYGFQDQDKRRHPDCPLAESPQKWIPVTERLPVEKINPNTHDFEYILCVTIWGDVRPFKYGTPIGSKDAHFWNGAGYVDAYVTHWMPLPEPPTADNDK